MALNTAAEALIDPETGDFNLTYIRSSMYPLIAYDDSLAIIDLKTGQEIGVVQSLLAIGTPSQVRLKMF